MGRLDSALAVGETDLAFSSRLQVIVRVRVGDIRQQLNR